MTELNKNSQDTIAGYANAFEHESLERGGLIGKVAVGATVLAALATLGGTAVIATVAAPLALLAVMTGSVSAGHYLNAYEMTKTEKEATEKGFLAKLQKRVDNFKKLNRAGKITAATSAVAFVAGVAAVFLAPPVAAIGLAVAKTSALTFLLGMVGQNATQQTARISGEIDKLTQKELAKADGAAPQNPAPAALTSAPAPAAAFDKATAPANDDTPKAPAAAPAAPAPKN